MVDFYGLPQQGDGAWPGRAKAKRLAGHLKASCVEQAMRDDLAAQLTTKRFIPFVLMHEFEGLLFSDCAAFSQGIGRPELENRFKKVRDGFETPEDINDSPDTAPSKRVEDIVPGYEKPLFGTLAIIAIGLATIRAECPHFDDWLTQLESAI